MSALAALWVGAAVAAAPGEVGGEPRPTVEVDEPDDAPDDVIDIGPPIEGTTGALPIRIAWVEHGRWHWGSAEARAVLGSTLTLGLEGVVGGGWEAALEGRVRHRLFVSAQGVASGELAPELRRANLRGTVSSGGLELGVGWEVVRWGRTQARPFDVVSPQDVRDGPLGPEGGERAPVLSLSARQPLGDGALALLVMPFYVAAQGTQVEASPAQDVVHSGELASRFTQRVGAFDLGLGWAWRFDRAPFLPGVDRALPPPARQHVLGAELAWGHGALRVLAEAAVFVDQRLFHRDLASERRAVVRWGLDAGLAPAVFLDVALGLEGAHAPGAAVRTLYEGPDDLWLRARVGLMLAFDGVLRLDGEARVGLLRDDSYTTAWLTWRMSSAASLGLGLTLLGGQEVDGGLGALYDGTDHAWLRFAWTR